ncbi:MAG: lysylphosphatidylglycerol synthase transmembrane domain-containing protein [Candidatus Korobacteraceae bacterium]|jgi:uncharacterized membrane protein YbhN (UPF0104 family)
MTTRRWLLMIASFALAIALIVLLIKVGKVDLRITLQQLRSVSLLSFAKIALLGALQIYLSTEKWRRIDAAWRRPTDSVPPRTTSYALTSIGLAMGIFLPVQLAMAGARTLGTYVHGGALKRGTAGTLLEQGFDVYTVGFLALASGITWYCHGGAKTWAICASVSVVLALLAVEPAVRIARWLAARWKAPTGGLFSRTLRSVWELQHSGILNAGLARRLVGLSALRTGTIVLMSIQTAEAVGLHIPAWQMAAATPFVSIAFIIAVTPGGIGVNDLAGAGALDLFGTPFTIGAQWVLANRVLTVASYLLLAACSAVVLGAEGIVAPSSRGPTRETKQ